MTLDEFQKIIIGRLPDIFPVDFFERTDMGVRLDKDGKHVSIMFSDDDAAKMTERSVKERLAMALSMLRNQLAMEEPNNRKLLEAVL
jgi:hypothetical protein